MNSGREVLCPPHNGESTGTDNGNFCSILGLYRDMENKMETTVL